MKTKLLLLGLFLQCLIYSAYGAESTITTINAGTLNAVATLPAVAEAGPSYLLEEDFEGAGTPSGWSVGASPDFDYATSPAPIEGSQSLLTVAPNTATSASFAGDATTWFYVVMNVPGAIGANTAVFTIRNASASIAYVTLRASGQWQVFHGAADAVASTYTAGTYHLWVKYVASSGANDGVIELYVSSDSTKPESATVTESAGTSTDTPVAVRFLGYTSYNIIWDDFKVSNSVIGSAP